LLISNQTDSIALSISEDLARDSTTLTGENLIEQNVQKMLLAVVGARQILKLQTIVLSRDKSVISLLINASEMIGSTAHTST
jgi:uncharacterized membrane-anchored protein YitT (DUF2179 family)